MGLDQIRSACGVRASGVRLQPRNETITMSSTRSAGDPGFVVGDPPPGWLDACRDSESKARALHLWERTMDLIKHEPVLSVDPDRYLAMISDHRVSAPKRRNNLRHTSGD